MHTPRPAAGATYSFGQFVTSSLNATAARLDTFSVFNPADPFVSSQWSDSTPGSKSKRLRCQCSSQIVWECMNDTFWNLLYSHSLIIHEQVGVSASNARRQHPHDANRRRFLLPDSLYHHDRLPPCAPWLLFAAPVASVSSAHWRQEGQRRFQPLVFLR